MAWAASVQRQGEAQRGDLSGLPTETHDVHFELTSEQQWLRCKCRALAADFATRSAAHDRDASHPVENYQRLREEGFLALTIGKEWGGQGASLLDHTIAYEALGAGCPSTALAFNMHASVVMPVLESPEVTAATKKWLADLVGRASIFKTLRIEQLFRAGALGPPHPPPSDFCLYNLGLYELGRDAVELLPPMKPEQAPPRTENAGAKAQ